MRFTFIEYAKIFSKNIIYNLFTKWTKQIISKPSLNEWL